jgi:type IV pilus assembly protein PilB
MAKILIVDDDPAVAIALQQVLISPDYEIISFHQIELAQAYLEQHTRPDLILADVKMQGNNGHQLCLYLQEKPEWAHIPVLFLTSHDDEKDQHKAFHWGAVDFLAKPLTPQLLYDYVEKYVKLGQVWQQHHLRTNIDRHGQNLLSHVKPLLPLQEFLNYATNKLSLKFSQGQPTRDIYALFEAQGVAPSVLAQMIAQYSEFAFLPHVQDLKLHLGVLPLPFCQTYQVIPIHHDKDQLAFVLSNPFQLELQDLLQQHAQAPWLIAPPQVLRQAFRIAEQPEAARLERSSALYSSTDINAVMTEFQLDYLEKHTGKRSNSTLAEDLNGEAPSIIRMVNQIIENAHQAEASDIHIEPWKDGVAIRYRIDGQLHLMGKLTPLSVIEPLAARLKIMSNLDVSEHRLPQDGRIQFQNYSHTESQIDLRVSTAPMNHGEKIVMRILDQDKTVLPLEKLGFTPPQIELYRQQMNSPYGMILHVGPTGSGKSMTLYAAVHEINDLGINIQTAEDPIEYTLYGINQMQVKPEIGLTFARALRAYMRQDPDVILVGEIRDKETALTAIEAALTGHLLLSTLHTNDAPSTLIRFVEMGIEPFMISSSILMICAQRLVRRLCQECREPYQASPEEQLWLQYSGLEITGPLYRASSSGCSACKQIGYRGRVGVYELLIPNDAVRQALNQKDMTAEVLKSIAITQGMRTLFQEGLNKVAQGLTSIEEILNHIRQDALSSPQKGSVGN